jgi:O-antigen ligase
VEVFYLLMAASALVWAVYLMQFHGIIVGSIVFLIMTSVFPPEFAKVDVGGLSLTADRLWLGILLAQFVLDFFSGRVQVRSLTGNDLWMFLFVTWLILRTIVTPIGKELPGQPSTVMHLINGYLTPVLLFVLIRNSSLKPKDLWPAVGLILIFGVYLSVTAVLEIAKQWSLVFPQFIGDPKLGIHFGRARGPMLQSVRLGMCLNFCLATLWAMPLWIYARERWAWLLAIGLTPLYSLAILLTYTRSIWMGAAAILVILLATLLRGKVRMISLGSLVVFGSMAVLIVGPSLVAFKREYGEAETLESTKMRGAFAYVSIQMFKDKPLMGFGFNQFQVYNRPYLDDRTTKIRLESIRGYVHHNSYLSLVVDLGLIGFVLFVVASLSMIRNAWTLWMHPMTSDYGRSAAILGFCMAAVHAIQMAFHEVSFSSIEYTILMFSMGLVQVYRDELVALTSGYREYAERAEENTLALAN